MESGPLFARVRVCSTYGASAMTTDWILYAGSRTLEADVTLDWHEQRKLLKLSFPVNVSDPQATWEIPYGHVSRPPEGHEEPGHRWIDLTGRQGQAAYGLAVLNDAKYGYSVTGNDLRVSVVRAPLYGHRSRQPVKPEVDYDWQNQGRQTLRLLLIPHAGDWRDAGLPRAAEELTAPIPIIHQGIHPGSRSQADSFFSVDASNIVVSAVKQAESNGDLILRCFETGGRETEATLDLRFLKRQWTGMFRPSEIKTLRIHCQTGTIRQVNALEE
jgi:alpha-mannosidase